MKIELYDVWISLKAILKRYRLLVLFLVELAMMIGYAGGVVSIERINATLELNGSSTYERALERGIYDITVEYEAPMGGYAEATIGTLDKLSMYSDRVELKSEDKEVAFQVWANKRLDRFQVSFGANEGEVSIRNVQIQTADNSKLYLLMSMFAKMMLINLFLIGFMYRENLQKHSFVICGVLGITFICSIGLFTRYMLMGHDAMFHLVRIEGLKDGFLSGAFPVKIQPTWNNGWGYAVSTMYGDAVILLPALMRMCGFTLQMSWKTFIVAINLVTAILAYYSFFQICRNKYKAMFITLLYCTGIYRLTCIYVRAAVGEFAVMAFLPLVVLFFWYALFENTEDKNYGKRMLFPVIGFSGMLQTHVLTCEISAFFIVALCLIFIKKICERKTLLYLVRVAVITVLVNLWFLVPFLQFFGEELLVCKMTEMREDFQIWGLSVTELFATIPSTSFWFTFGENVSLAYKCTFMVGTALWICAAVILYLLWNKKLKYHKITSIMLGFGLVAAFMTTSLFPYQTISEYFPRLAGVLSKIQFSYRFLGMVGLFVSLAMLFAVMGVYGEKYRKCLLGICIGISVLAAFQGMDYQYRILYTGMSDTKYGAVSLNTTEVISGEYLYEGTDVTVTKYDRSIIGAGVEVTETEKKYLKATANCKVYDAGAYVEFPIFYYPGYRAEDENGIDYKVIRSENNNRIRVELPKGFEGKITVSFKEPLLWRICEIISLFAIIGIFTYEKTVMRKYGGRKRRNTKKTNESILSEGDMQ